MNEDVKLFLLGIIIVIVGIISIAVGVYVFTEISTVTSVIGIILILAGGILAYKKGQNL